MIGGLRGISEPTVMSGAELHVFSKEAGLPKEGKSSCRVRKSYIFYGSSNKTCFGEGFCAGPLNGTRGKEIVHKPGGRTQNTDSAWISRLLQTKKILGTLFRLWKVNCTE